MHDLAVVIVSSGQSRWLPDCLSSILARCAGLSVDVVVVENRDADAARKALEGLFPAVRLLTAPNRGFAHANNEGLLTVSARYVLLLNPDTEVLEGDFPTLLARLDERPELGLAGVRQLDDEGRVHPTIRRFPSVLRALGEAIGAERLPLVRRWSSERVVEPAAYERETDCDWTSGSYLLARREALASAGLLDERFFLYSEETDLCLRIRQAGWRVAHLPQMTILHHTPPTRMSASMAAQRAYSRRLYVRKHFPPVRRALFLGVVAARHSLRSVVPGDNDRRQAERAALLALLGRRPPPFGAPPSVALRGGRDRVYQPRRSK